MTRLIRVSDDLLDFLGSRDINGNRLTYEWGEPDEKGVYTPTVYTHSSDLGNLIWRVRRALGDLQDAMDKFDGKPDD